MIVSVCSDKGSPGVSTLATALGVVWPGDRVVLDADTAGGDLPFRLWTGDNPGTGGRVRLSPAPSIAQLATATRLGLTGAGPTLVPVQMPGCRGGAGYRRAVHFPEH